VIAALVGAGRRVVALDCRGHGESGKPHDPAAYAGTAMADDVIAVLDHLAIPEADIMGYSMGGFLTASLLVRHPSRFRSAILAGVGDMVNQGGPDPERGERIAEALLAPSAEAVTDPVARTFRRFAERNGNDLVALAALQRAERFRYDPARLADVRIPVMVLVGREDALAQTADRLAARLPNARLRTVPGDHLTAVNADFIREVLAFLDEVSPVARP
jgi:pimeloyl-ACP methyl ester carboxylesterase